MMEHEQINDRCVALSTRCTKMTGRILAQMMRAYLRKMQKPKIKRGQQSTKSLAKHGDSLADIEISGDNIGTFKKTARKYNLDFSLEKDATKTPPLWVVKFRAKDDKSMQSAFKEYSRAILKQKAPKKSMLAKLNRFKELVKSTPHRAIERVKDAMRQGR